MQCNLEKVAALSRASQRRLAGFFGGNADQMHEAMMNPEAAVTMRPRNYPWGGKLTRKRRAKRFLQTRAAKNDGGEPALPIIDNHGQFFRCEIHAASAVDHQRTNAECKAMVVQAGGRVLEEVEYIGGFLYDMKAPENENPLEDGDETVSGGHIHISPWSSLQQPQYNPMRMHPPGGIMDQLIQPKEEEDIGETEGKFEERISMQLNA